MLVVAGRELLTLLQVVHELVDVEILKSGGAKEKSKIKTNPSAGMRGIYGFRRSLISGSTLISIGSSFPFIAALTTEPYFRSVNSYKELLRKFRVVETISTKKLRRPLETTNARSFTAPPPVFV